MDSGLSAKTTYVYQIKAVGSLNNVSAPSNVDIATTILFTDDPIVAGSTLIKASQLTELRTAVNAVRTAAGLDLATFIDSNVGGVPIKATHVLELRTFLDAARSAIGLPPITYTNLLVPGTSTIQAIDFTEIRNGVK